MMNFKDDLLWKTLVYIACILVCSFLTRELQVCARATCRYDVKNGTCSLDWSIPVNQAFLFIACVRI